MKHDFSILFLSEYTNSPVHHLYDYPKQELYTPFNFWRIILRMTHAREHIGQGMLEIMTMAPVPEARGYARKAAFFKAFKSVIVTTPLAFNQAKP